jgi:hypothetical protein
VLYDFRTRLAQIGSLDWRRPEQLAGEERAMFLNLVHLWERMTLARHASAASGSSQPRP